MASIKKINENKFKIIVSNGYRTNGTKIRETKIVEFSDELSENEKEKKLYRIAEEFEHFVKNGSYLDGNKITLEQFITVWERIVQEGKTYAPSTWHTYHERIHNIILPSLGHIKIGKIQPHHIIMFMNNLTTGKIQTPSSFSYTPSPYLQQILAEEQRPSIYKNINLSYRTFLSIKKGNNTKLENAQKIANFYKIPFRKVFIIKQKPLSKRTLAHYQNLLSTIFTTAVHWQVIEKSPVTSVEKIKVKKKKPVYFDDISVIKFLNLLETAPFKYKIASYLAIDTGLRISELMGLKWSKVNENDHSIDITDVRQYISNYGEVNKEPKTEVGTRNITLSDTVYTMLMEYKKYQERNKKIYKDIWEDYEHIITNEDGKKMFPNTPSSWLKKFLKSNDLPSVTFHGLRHTNASLLISQNINPATLAERLGHSDKEVTLNIYTHAIKSKDKIAASKMDEIYKKVKPTLDVSVF